MVSMVDQFYNRLIRPLVFQLDPETAHRLTLALLEALPPLARPTTDPDELRQSLWGLDFSNPLGLAAGLDKDAKAVGAWQAMGFGFAELGTITPRPQPGNPRPRLWRLPGQQALINRLGFPGEGMEAIAARLKRLRMRDLGMRLALNFGPNKDTPPEKVADDCVTLMKNLAAFADFVVINLSSPNTPGLRDWQAPEQMRALFDSVLSAPIPTRRRPPVLVKLAPDLSSEQLAAICDTTLALGLDGIVATNTTLMREQVGVRSEHPGGLSGQPLKLRARAVIREIYRNTQARIPIIGVGGVAGPEDAYGHITAGASLVELYTGLIYQGPALPSRIKQGLLAMLRRDGLGSIRDAVGVAA